MAQTLNVVVVGGSLGGLFAGIVLKRLGHHVRIFERNPTPLLHDQGAGIVAGGEVQAFFQTHDLSRSPIAVTSTKGRRTLDKHGHVKSHEALVQEMTSWDLLYHLLRANFDHVKSEYADVPRVQEGEGDGRYEYGCQVTALHDLGAGKGIEVTIKKKDEAESTTIADLLIAADGGSSTVRSLLLPDVKRTYAGYVAWRGTVPEANLSIAAASIFVETMTIFWAPGLLILNYLIPGRAGSLQPGERLANWVWYCDYSDGSPEHTELMTDVDGNLHRVTVPVGKVAPAVFEKQKEYARLVLPPQFTELVESTQVPFVQAITDVISPRCSLNEGRVLLLGDALAGFRPHTAASTSQAAFDAMALGELIQGKLTLEGFEERCLSYAENVQRSGVQIGNRSQLGQGLGPG